MDEVEYELQGGECELCQSMAGTVSDYPLEPLHPNCACKSTPRCNNRFSFQGDSTHYGPAGECFIFNAEITVTCWDGSEIGLSVPIDMGCEAEAGDVFEAIDAAVEEEAQALMDSCPDCLVA
jgi:hypothetical protein